ncbi:hypothetical protein LJ656_30475 [Paraburkholderia sp. MMS20-SJTR3]|uniref:Uncharacterized protein n=1 Tax=Paraburkholderia sejongensis TaxID=2886946 RepID=A0ABS8K414_9BURK|nr:hypothetical protein [Paraburkholderia sp. MMS20-SJTR3]MCC8396905.1 hypothetical protein [Paraburkholderia sp. MMS20-SJTR3]
MRDIVLPIDLQKRARHGEAFSKGFFGGIIDGPDIHPAWQREYAPD